MTFLKWANNKFITEFMIYTSLNNTLYIFKNLKQNTFSHITQALEHNFWMLLDFLLTVSGTILRATELVTDCLNMNFKKSKLRHA